MELKAQALKCALQGIIGFRQEREGVRTGYYLQGAYDLLSKYVGKRAVAIIKDLKVGKVGGAKDADGVRELSAFVIL